MIKSTNNLKPEKFSKWTLEATDELFGWSWCHGIGTKFLTRFWRWRANWGSYIQTVIFPNTRRLGLQNCAPAKHILPDQSWARSKDFLHQANDFMKFYQFQRPVDAPGFKETSTSPEIVRPCHKMTYFPRPTNLATGLVEERRSCNFRKLMENKN